MQCLSTPREQMVSELLQEIPRLARQMSSSIFITEYLNLKYCLSAKTGRQSSAKALTKVHGRFTWVRCGNFTSAWALGLTLIPLKSMVKLPLSSAGLVRPVWSASEDTTPAVYPRLGCFLSVPPTVLSAVNCPKLKYKLCRWQHTSSDVSSDNLSFFP